MAVEDAVGDRPRCLAVADSVEPCDPVGLECTYSEVVLELHEQSVARAAPCALRLVASALAEIPAAAREVIWLGRFVFEDYDDLARALGCTASAARVRMHRAMQQLNATFARMNGVPIDV
jgi:DNA-directed RNA polymerase specialized sigma24 family protein